MNIVYLIFPTTNFSRGIQQLYIDEIQKEKKRKKNCYLLTVPDNLINMGPKEICHATTIAIHERHHASF